MINRIKMFLCILIVVFSVSASPIANQIAYQGILTDANRNPLKDSSGYNLTFSLDTTEAGSTPIWTENQVVATSGGIFSVMLGSVTPLTSVLFDKQYWLSVRRDNGGQIGNKIKLGVVPFSKRAMVADSAGIAATSYNTLKLTGKIVDSSTIVSKSIRNSEIADGTITRDKLNTGFKAPYADKADTANRCSVADSTIKVPEVLFGDFVSAQTIEHQYFHPNTTSNIIVKHKFLSIINKLYPDFAKKYCVGDNVVGFAFTVTVSGGQHDFVINHTMTLVISAYCQYDYTTKTFTIGNVTTKNVLGHNYPACAAIIGDPTIDSEKLTIPVSIGNCGYSQPMTLLLTIQYGVYTP